MFLVSCYLIFTVSPSLSNCPFTFELPSTWLWMIESNEVPEHIVYTMTRVTRSECPRFRFFLEKSRTPIEINIRFLFFNLNIFFKFPVSNSNLYIWILFYTGQTYQIPDCPEQFRTSGNPNHDPSFVVRKVLWEPFALCQIQFNSIKWALIVFKCI